MLKTNVTRNVIRIWNSALVYLSKVQRALTLNEFQKLAQQRLYCFKTIQACAWAMRFNMANPISDLKMRFDTTHKDWHKVCFSKIYIQPKYREMNFYERNVPSRILLGTLECTLKKKKTLFSDYLLTTSWTM